MSHRNISISGAYLARAPQSWILQRVHLVFEETQIQNQMRLKTNNIVKNISAGGFRYDPKQDEYIKNNFSVETGGHRGDFVCYDFYEWSSTSGLREIKQEILIVVTPLPSHVPKSFANGEINYAKLNWNRSKYNMPT